MIIRSATEKDISQILLVLKASLGEISSQKTEKVWRFKHILNPFGKSLVLVAEEDNKIIGVRAFMRWKWQKGFETYSAFRAVDTATHPQHQGRGIFKKLTLEALDLGKEEGNDFVFNTPNSRSKPGYLKMGWKEVGKLEIGIRPVNPLHWKRKKNNSYNIEYYPMESQKYIENFNVRMEKTQFLFTPRSKQYLEWRYIHNPLQKYEVISCSDYFIAAYVKSSKGFRELRISEILISNIALISEVKRKIKNLAKETGVNIITYGKSNELNFLLGKKLNIGPVLTFKTLSLDERLNNEFFEINRWSYNLGELELF